MTYVVPTGLGDYSTCCGGWLDRRNKGVLVDHLRFRTFWATEQEPTFYKLIKDNTLAKTIRGELVLDKLAMTSLFERRIQLKLHKNVHLGNGLDGPSLS